MCIRDRLGVTSHSRLEEWGGLGMLTPTNLCQQEAMTHLNPKSCMLVAGGNAPFQLSTPERSMASQGRTQTPQLQ